MRNKTSNSTEPAQSEWVVTRRSFLKSSGLVIAGLGASRSALFAAESGAPTKLSFGIVTDSHYADIPPSGRFYRESLAKMTECVNLMNDKKVDFLVMLGDLIDSGGKHEKGAGDDATLKHLDAIEGVFQKYDGPRYHVLGNHDLEGLSKQQFQKHVENTGIDKSATYYSYDLKGIHFVVLDACFNQKMEPYDHGNFGWRQTWIPSDQLEWLKKDLASTSKPVIVFVHQLLSGKGNVDVKNSDEVREILEENGNVLAAFHGHHHRGKYKLIEGIHYYTLIAMVEGSGEKNSSYAIVEVHTDNSLTITGYRRAVSEELAAGATDSKSK